MDKQIKSKDRVADFGEVFTNEREVKAMCDLVKNETENIDSTFLEPACGDGNFLAEILTRKLTVVKERYGKQPNNYEKYSIVALSSLYGVDILQDNIERCIERLYSIWDNEYTKLCKKDCSDECRESAKYILSKNILCGDALSLLKNDGTPIVFAEWKLVTGSMIKRRDFELAKLLKVEEEGLNEFFLETIEGWIRDEETNGLIPPPIKEYPLADYREVQKNE